MQDRGEKTRGAVAPLWIPHSTPGWGCPDWPPARRRRRSGGGAGRRRPPAKEEGAAAPSTEQRRGLCPLPAEREREGIAPSQIKHRGPGGPLAAHGRRHSAGGAPNWGGAGHPKKRRGLCPLNKDAQGAGRPPGRVQGRRHGAGGGLPPPEVPEEGEGRR